MNLKVVSPILGFESIKEVVLKQMDDFFYELDCNDIRFTMIDSKTIVENYSFELLNSYKKVLEIKSLDEAKIFNIVTIHNPIEESTINFLAPIVINEEKKLLAQIALDDKRYNFSLKEPIKNFL